MLIHVDNPDDSRLDRFRWRDRQLASKLDRLETVGAGLFVAEGDLVVDRALDAGCIPVALLCDEETAQRYDNIVADVEIYVGNEHLRRDVTGLGVPLKATGLFQRPPLRTPTDLLSHCQRIAVAEAIDNPTNLGAIIRSATALGWDGLLLTRGSADPLARRALRVSMGSGLNMAFARLAPEDNEVELLHRHQFTTIALTPDESAIDISRADISQFERVALLLGSERSGLLPHSIMSADVVMRIPMFHNTDSLNVAAAAAIALYALGPRT